MQIAPIYQNQNGFQRLTLSQRNIVNGLQASFWYNFNIKVYTYFLSSEHVDWETEALFDYEPYPTVVKKLNNITREGHV